MLVTESIVNRVYTQSAFYKRNGQYYVTIVNEVTILLLTDDVLLRNNGHIKTHFDSVLMYFIPSFTVKLIIDVRSMAYVFFHKNRSTTRHTQHEKQLYIKLVFNVDVFIYNNL